MFNPTGDQLAATICFTLAILHTFSVSLFNRWANRCRSGSVKENFLHLMGEVEVVFGLWAGIYLFILALMSGLEPSVQYLESLNFTEPFFVFVVMTVSATRPVLEWATFFIGSIARVLPLPANFSFYFVTLTVGPLLGSFITEPAAMTVTALILLERFMQKKVSSFFKYCTLGLLFVNVSIGGTLTPFAAPPVLMVSSIWNWDLMHMLTHFGWKSALACVVTTAIGVVLGMKDLKKIPQAKRGKAFTAPFWVGALHLVMLAAIVFMHTRVTVFLGLFLFFLGVVTVTKEYQNELKLREALLVAFFLGGLVVLGQPQRWWLEPVLTQLSAGTLFIGAAGLTAIMDNAALTYLGAQVPDISEMSKYALVAGAVTGGGLTVIANAPNPAGYSILNSTFGENGISAPKLFAGAMLPTLIAAACFWFL